MSITDPQAFLTSILQRQGLARMAVDNSSKPAKVPTTAELANTQSPAKPTAAPTTNEKTPVSVALTPSTTEHSYAAKPSQEESSGSSSESSSSSEEGDSDSEEYKQVVKVEERKVPARGRGRPRKYTDDFASVKNNSNSSATPPRPGRPKQQKARTPTSAAVNSQQLALTPRAVMSEGGHRKRGKGCGGCLGCQREDCGTCIYCKDKPKFGGPGKKKQRCAKRVCSNFVNAPGVKRLHKAQTTAQSSSSPLLSKLAPIAPKESTVTTTTVKEMVKNTPPVTTISVTSTGSKTAMVTITTLPSSMPAITTTATSEKPKEVKKDENDKKRKDKKQEHSDEELEEKKDDGKMQCVQCGRERLKSMARSNTFCTQRCAKVWEDGQPEGITRVDAVPIDRSKKHPSRELKNLHIDMALPGTTLPHNGSTKEGATSSPSEPMDTAPPPPPLKRPSLRSSTASPKPAPPVSSSAVATKPAGGIMKKATGGPGSAKKTVAIVPKKIEATGAANKRPAVTTQSQTPVAKKVKIDTTSSSPLSSATTSAATTTSVARGVTFDLLPMTTLKPISAPPLNRGVPPPPISIVPLDQLSALGDALQNKKGNEVEKRKFPHGLPKDVRSWSIAQVVQYFGSTSDCHDYADLFKEQEVDGTSLLLLTHESLVKCLNIKLGRALKIMLHVEELRKMYEKQ